jgi:hypothetical protein
MAMKAIKRHATHRPMGRQDAEQALPADYETVKKLLHMPRYRFGRGKDNVREIYPRVMAS